MVQTNHLHDAIHYNNHKFFDQKDNLDNSCKLASQETHQNHVFYLGCTYNDPYKPYSELLLQHHENGSSRHKYVISHENNKNNNSQPYRNFLNMLKNENILKTMRDDVKLLQLQDKFFQNQKHK